MNIHETLLLFNYNYCASDSNYDSCSWNGDGDSDGLVDRVFLAGLILHFVVELTRARVLRVINRVRVNFGAKGAFRIRYHLRVGPAVRTALGVVSSETVLFVANAFVDFKHCSYCACIAFSRNNDLLVFPAILARVWIRT